MFLEFLVILLWKSPVTEFALPLDLIGSGLDPSWFFKGKNDSTTFPIVFKIEQNKIKAKLQWVTSNLGRRRGRA